MVRDWGGRGGAEEVEWGEAGRGMGKAVTGEG